MAWWTSCNLIKDTAVDILRWHAHISDVAIVAVMALVTVPLKLWASPTCPKYRCSPKDEGDWKGRAPSKVLCPKTPQKKGFGPSFLRSGRADPVQFKGFCWKRALFAYSAPKSQRFLRFLRLRCPSGHIRPRQGTEICNFGAPSPLEALHWIFWLFLQYLCAI